MRRRSFMLSVAAALAPAALRAAPAATLAGKPIRLGLTPVFLDDQVAFLRVWRSYLESRLNRPVVLVQRGRYREIVETLGEDKLDFAWLCGYPYVRFRRQLRLLAVPVYQGRPLYQSYLIVPASDALTRSILDLRGKVFAYSDPDSNSGFLYANYSLIRLKEQPTGFFAKSFFTWAHRKVVEAVASRLAQGGSVDGYVWDTLARSNPELTSRTRIVERSPKFGFPPFVARASIVQSDFDAMQRALVEMAGDAEGRALLEQLNLDRFTVGGDNLFDGIEHMMRAVNRTGDAPAT